MITTPPARERPDDPDDTEIVYAPGAQNHYKYAHDVIVLDERLKDYPRAHAYIKNHELEHARQGTLEDVPLAATLRLEFRTDCKHYFGDDETIAEVRAYFAEKRERDHISARAAVKLTAESLCREVWDLALRPLSWVYWRVRE